MSRYNLAWLIAVPMAVLTGALLSVAAPAKRADSEYKLVRTVVDVLAEVDQHYVRPLDEKQKEKLVEDMINGGLDRLDPYSQYMSADEFRQFNNQTKGDFGGVGIHLGQDPRTGMLMVISPMVGTPAHEAGVLAGDIIIKIDDKPTENMRHQEAVRMIQGEPGTPISLTVLHDGARQTETFNIVRAKIEVPTVLGLTRREDNLKEFDWFADRTTGIAYIRVIQFTETTTVDLKKAIERLQGEGMRGLVLDLRDNPGGLLKSAIEVSDLFLASGTIVSTKDRKGNGPTAEARESGTLLEPAAKHPIAVLVNKQSASASEIVAAALQDHNRAVVVGERSFGKGSVQKVIEMGGTALKLTTDTYWRPSGVNMHRYPDSKDTDDWGVKPSEGLEIKMDDAERLAYLKAKRAKDIVGKLAPKEKEVAFVDRALDKAVEHLKKELAKQ
jgi:carboxyl-terminal processing protease